MSPEQSSSKIGKSVGEKLRAARLALHYTQSQLAAPDFSVSYISAIERGQIHPSLRALEILAARLGLSSTQLLPNRAQTEDRLATAAGTSETDEEELDLILLEAQLLIHSGSPIEAHEQLHSISTKRLKRPQQLLYHYLLGCAHYKMQQFQECEYTLSEALQLTKEVDNPYLSLHILYQLALCYAAMRNYNQAISTHQRCLTQLEENTLPDPLFTAQVYIHMGQHYTHLNNYTQALEMFNKALDITRNLATSQAIEQSYRELGNYYSEHKQYDLATLYAYKGIQLHQQQEQRHLRSQFYHYLGHAIMDLDAQKARDFLDEAIQREGTGRDQLTLASLFTRNAEWFFQQQDLAQALENAQQARTLAEVFGDTLIAAEALIILGRIEYALQNYEDGDQHFAAGLDMLERLDFHENLANEAVRYSQLLEEIGKAREAFTYLRRAYQSQQRLKK